MSDRIERARCQPGPSLVRPVPSAPFNAKRRHLETFLFTLFPGTPLWLWFSFIGIVVAQLAFDLGVLNKTDHEIGIRESLKLSALYISLGVAFSGLVWRSKTDAPTVLDAK